ncbi:hypothetical protein [Effusibacillus consociatus]|uniref:LysE type translocator n=1 Tax=Effusibacillus consociatus TaxID=1117041 RepID=A0ABV9Q6C6_9BACL
MGFLFCPTLFWLFFGVVVPKSGTSSTRFFDPVFFAVGTTIPLLLYTLFLSTGTALLTKVIDRTWSVHRVSKVLSGTMFLLSGIYETISYWLI